MDSITINFHGDFHITISPDLACNLMKSMGKMANSKEAPEGVALSEGYKALVQAVEEFLNGKADEYEMFGSGAQDEDIDSIVVVLRPGEAPKVMTESECYECVERFGQFCSGLTINAPDICAYGLKAVYDPRAVLPVGEERYLIGAVIVYASDCDGDSISLGAEEVMAAIVYFSEHTATLCADGKEFPAFLI